MEFFLCVSGDPESVAGEYGRHSLYKMLGYFSLVGLLRLHSLLGDYYQAIKVLENIELNKKVSFASVPLYIFMVNGIFLLCCPHSCIHAVLCLTEHVLACARVPDHHLLLCGVRLLDDEALSGCHPSLCQHPALHPEDQKPVPEVYL